MATRGYHWMSRRGPSVESPSIWVHISPENDITITVVKAEMGQGVATSLPMILAEELEADWKSVRIKLLPEVDDYLLPDARLNGTVDSISVRSRYRQMRVVGAAAKEMLVAAAAQVWEVEPSTLKARNSTVSHPVKGVLTYGELAQLASTLPVPSDPVLKRPEEFTIIGTSPLRLDGRQQVDGTARYGIDSVVDDMAYGAVLLSPVAGGEVANFSALSSVGRKDITLVQVPNGLVAVGKSWWDASNALRSLDVQFTTPPETKDLNSASISAKLAADLQGPTKQVETSGDPQSAMKGASARRSGAYEVPFLDHAALEPLNATAFVTADSCTVWAPVQTPVGVIQLVESLLGLPSSAVTVHQTFLGGGFGRKDTPVDFVSHAIIASAAVVRPVKVIWSREQDIRHGAYRAPARAEISFGVDAGGNLVSWIAKLAASKVGYFWETLSLAGFWRLPYAIPNRDIQWVEFNSPVRTGFFRSVNQSHNIFFVESSIDEAAHACSADPLAFRLRHTQQNPRATAVLNKVAEMARWGRPRIEGAFQGVALFDYTANDDTRTVVAHVAEVTVDSAGKLKVHTIYCAIDCGFAVNPDGVKAQMEGGSIFGLTAALLGEITIKDGAVEQSNFHDYRLLGLRDSPNVETEIINSGSIPAGVGEYGVPGVMPAVTNAIFAATGTRIRTLPALKQKLR
ncbi:MAG: molybdopterin cofactor-binding domain-containing protein [Bryobacteraceae bacterium]